MPVRNTRSKCCFAFLGGLLLALAAGGPLRAATLASSNPRAISLYNQGLELAGEDHFNEAVEKFKQAIQADSNFIQAHLRYMDAFQGVGRGDEVEGMYGNKVEKNPKNPVYHYLYGRALADIPAKRAQFFKAFDCDSTFYWAPYGIGGTYYMEGRLDEALLYLNRTLSLNPKMIDALRLLGEVYLQKGMLLQARDQFEAAARIDSQDVTNYIKLGQTYSQMERAESAEKAFRKAAALAPANPQPWYLLGLLAEVSGDTAKALDAYRKFLELSPNDDIAPLVRRNIEKLQIPGGGTKQ